MARVVAYEVQSDLSGENIPKGERCIVRFEFEDAKTRNFVADLSTVEGKALVEHCHAREVTPRVRKAAAKK
jgi:hypothetical protein